MNTQDETIIPQSAPTGGTFTVTTNGSTSQPIAFDASAAEVQTVVDEISPLPKPRYREVSVICRHCLGDTRFMVYKEDAPHDMPCYHCGLLLDPHDVAERGREAWAAPGLNP